MQAKLEMANTAERREVFDALLPKATRVELVGGVQAGFVESFGGKGRRRERELRIDRYVHVQRERERERERYIYI